MQLLASYRISIPVACQGMALNVSRTNALIACQYAALNVFLFGILVTCHSEVLAAPRDQCLSFPKSRAAVVAPER